MSPPMAVAVSPDAMVRYPMAVAVLPDALVPSQCIDPSQGFCARNGSTAASSTTTCSPMRTASVEATRRDTHEPAFCASIASGVFVVGARASWSRVAAPGTPFIPHGQQPGAFDSMGIYAGTPLIDPRNPARLLVYYEGVNVPHNATFRPRNQLAKYSQIDHILVS